MTDFDLQEYLNKGVEDVIRDALSTVLKSPREGAFLAKFSLAAKRAEALRRKHEKQGRHIPPFLIASIATTCNLRCKGCYANAVGSNGHGEQMAAEDWKNVFSEAEELGIPFILLAGGEPLMREDVISEAASHKNILFPVLTNGLLLKTYLPTFDKNRNLLPIISIEGDAEQTDQRRGEGVYRHVWDVMDQLCKRHIFFGVSITVMEENMEQVTSEGFLKELEEKGCKLVLYVEYVPMEEGTEALALTKESCAILERRVAELRRKEQAMMFISFPGDEKDSGGCLAAGRGFFHINPSGGAEPCPFSPYSDISVKDGTLLGALQSQLFSKLRKEEILTQDHSGGCVLFEQQEKVRELLG